MEDSNFWRAREQHYCPPEDEEDQETCEQCEGSGEAPHDCGEDTCSCIEPLPEICSTCEGSGYVYVQEKVSRLKEAREDYEYQKRKDEKMEERFTGLDEN